MNDTAEKQLLAHVRQAARVYHVLVYHTHDSRRSEPGFPDLVLVGKTIEFWELKTTNGRVSQEQRDWIAAIKATGHYAGVFRPDDWNIMVGRLVRLDPTNT